MTKCKNHSPEFKAKVALAVIWEDMILAELSKKYGAPPPQIGPWKRAAIKSMTTAFTRKGAAPEQVSAADADKLHPKIGQRVVERDFWPMPRKSCSGREAKMVRQDHQPSLRRQCALLTWSRSNLSSEPKGESAENLRFMDMLDTHFLETPWCGWRQMARDMKRNDDQCGRHRVRCLMRLMRGVPISQEPNTSKQHPRQTC